MKDAKGHGSNPRGDHSAGVDKIGVINIHPKAIAMLARRDATVKPETGAQPRAGFMVGTLGREQVVNPDAFSGPRGVALLKDFANRNADALSAPNAAIGRWTGPDGRVYLDVSHNIRDRRSAVRLGQAHNQIAVWDLKRKRAVPTGGTGRR